MKKVLYTLLALCSFVSIQAQDLIMFDWNNTPLPGNNISGLHAVGSGNTIWIATNQGTCRYNTNTGWTVNKLPQVGTLPNFLSSVVPDQNGQLYAGAFQNGVSTYNGTNWTNVAMGNIQDIHVDSLNQIWAASSDAGLLFYDGNTWTNYRTSNTGGFNSDVVNYVTDDGKGLLYVGFDPQGNWAGGMASFDGTNWQRWTTQINNLPDARINHIAFKADGSMLLASDGGLLEGSGANWTAYTTSNSNIPSNTVNAVAVDENGLIWVGTESGFSTFDGTTWTTFNTSNSDLADNRIRDIVFDNTGHTWMATGNGVAVYKAGGASVSIEEPLWAQRLGFQLTPNQLTADSELAYIIDLPQAAETQLSIFDMQGRIVARSDIQNRIPGIYEETMEIEKLTAGLYFARLQIEGFIRTEKFIVQ